MGRIMKQFVGNQSVVIQSRGGIQTSGVVLGTRGLSSRVKIFDQLHIGILEKEIFFEIRYQTEWLPLRLQKPDFECRFSKSDLGHEYFFKYLVVQTIPKNKTC